MKQIWKIVSLLCAFGILLTLPVFAGGDHANLPANYEPTLSETLPAPPLEEETVCVKCGIGKMIQVECTATDWHTYNYVDCECEGGYSPLRDAKQHRAVMIVSDCTNCMNNEMHTTTQERQIHIGYVTP